MITLSSKLLYDKPLSKSHKGVGTYSIIMRSMIVNPKTFPPGSKISCINSNTLTII